MNGLIIIIIILALMYVQISAIIVLEHRRSSRMAAWVFLVCLCPFLGFVFYLLLSKPLYRSKLLRKYALPRGSELSKLTEAEAGGRELLPAVPAEEEGQDPAYAEHHPRLIGLLDSYRQFPLTTGNLVKVLTNAESAYEAMKEQLRTAKHHIHLDYYLIRDDEVGGWIYDLLSTKASAGVEVRVLYDGLGSFKLSSSYIDKMKEAGVRMTSFLPVRLALFDKRLNYRNHRKLAVIDGRVGFVGGINLGEEYLGQDPKLGFWRDTHLQVEGECVKVLQEIFILDWNFAAEEQLGLSDYYKPTGVRGNEEVVIVSSGPTPYDASILEVLFEALNAARSRIYMTTPYFIPDLSLLMSLRTAALSGVDVRIILPGVSDSRLVLLASLSYVKDLMEAGVRFYRYQRGFLHAKVLLIDRELASVGSANVDMRSLHINFELNALLFGQTTIDRLYADFEQDLSDSMLLCPEEFMHRSKLQRLGEAAANILSPLL
ncbi:cardiolipin synthase [Paenibacillus sp. GCM10023252]|uniref:cardiolipin synthase n=1 Tax=Paenibacillus sp. GCM10023252 TaxID=3252649 RepID=UPI00361CA570